MEYDFLSVLSYPRFSLAFIARLVQSTVLHYLSKSKSKPHFFTRVKVKSTLSQSYSSKSKKVTMEKLLKY